MTETATERQLRQALNELMLAAAPFAYGRGMPEARGNLKCAIRVSNALLKGDDDGPSLAELADQADAEARERPGYRPDLDG